MGNWYGTDSYAHYVKLHMRELHEEAARARLARQASQRPGLRRRVGHALIVAGESLVRQPLDSCVPQEA